MNVPGEASSVVTALDGFEMTKQGRAGEAMAISAHPRSLHCRVLLHAQ